MEGESRKMRIAVCYEEGKVFYHVGDAKEFKVYEIENGQVIKTDILETTGNGRKMVLDFATEHKVNVIICGNVCSGAKDALKEIGVETFGCITGSADEAVEAYLKGDLKDNGTVACKH